MVVPNRKQKRLRGKAIDWDEIKQRRTINLTATAWDALQVKGAELGISRSEVIERTVRGLIQWGGKH